MTPFYTVTHDHTLGVAAPGLLQRGQRRRRQPSTLSIATQPGHGTVTLNADGSFNYAPAPDYSGYDSFTYTASDGLRTSRPAMVGITVAESTRRPTVIAIRY